MPGHVLASSAGLPGNFRCDLPRLERFLKALPRAADDPRRRLRHVVEFRHPSWYVSETYRLLERHGVALCAHDMSGSAIDTISIGPFAYVRFHGATGRYRGSYGDRTLTTWAARLAEERHAGRDVYAYFNNDPDAVATKNALKLRSRIKQMTSG
jgi:uncharacterized protein YecE (DUF72 family)